MLKKIINGLVFVLLVCPEGLAIFTLGMIMELIYRLGVHLGYLKPGIELLLVVGSFVLGLMLFSWKMLVYYFKKHNEARRK